MRQESFALTGLEEEDVDRPAGRPGPRPAVLERRTIPVATVLEWGVRALEVPVSVSGERDAAASAKADLFPAYDDDGGLLLVLTPDN